MVRRANPKHGEGSQATESKKEHRTRKRKQPATHEDDSENGRKPSKIQRMRKDDDDILQTIPFDVQTEVYLCHFTPPCVR